MLQPGIRIENHPMFYQRKNVKERFKPVGLILHVEVLMSRRHSILNGMLYQLSCQVESFGVVFLCFGGIVDVSGKMPLWWAWLSGEIE